VTGAVQKPGDYTLAQIQALPKIFIAGFVSGLKSTRTNLVNELRHVDAALSVLGKLKGEQSHQTQAHYLSFGSQADEPRAKGAGLRRWPRSGHVVLPKCWFNLHWWGTRMPALPRRRWRRTLSCRPRPSAREGTAAYSRVLTTVRQPMKTMGTAAHDHRARSHQRRSGKNGPHHPPPNRPELIVRESTRNVKWPPRTPNRAFSVDRVKYVVAVLIRFNKGI